MTLWAGETWTCEKCGFINAVLRKRCRNAPCDGRQLGETEPPKAAAR